MRLFVAIQLSDDMRKSIVTLKHDLKAKGIKGNYTPLQNLHLTMCFIGRQMVDNLRCIRIPLRCMIMSRCRAII